MAKSEVKCVKHHGWCVVEQRARSVLGVEGEGLDGGVLLMGGIGGKDFLTVGVGSSGVF